MSKILSCWIKYCTDCDILIHIAQLGLIVNNIIANYVIGLNPINWDIFKMIDYEEMIKFMSGIFLYFVKLQKQ